MITGRSHTPHYTTHTHRRLVGHTHHTATAFCEPHPFPTGSADVSPLFSRTSSRGDSLTLHTTALAVLNSTTFATPHHYYWDRTVRCTTVLIRRLLSARLVQYHYRTPPCGLISIWTRSTTPHTDVLPRWYHLPHPAPRALAAPHLYTTFAHLPHGCLPHFTVTHLPHRTTRIPAIHVYHTTGPTTFPTRR